MITHTMSNGETVIQTDFDVSYYFDREYSQVEYCQGTDQILARYEADDDPDVWVQVRLGDI